MKMTKRMRANYAFSGNAKEAGIWVKCSRMLVSPDAGPSHFSPQLPVNRPTPTAQLLFAYLSFLTVVNKKVAVPGSPPLVLFIL